MSGGELVESGVGEIILESSPLVHILAGQLR